MNNYLKVLKNPCRLYASLSAKGHLSWVQDKIAIKLIYKGQMGKKLNLESPQTFNEKLQWLKLYDRKPIYTELVDKHEVRKYISEWIGTEYLIPELGIWSDFESINFKLLPNQFVLKCTHDSGSAIVCRDKDAMEMERMRIWFSDRLRKSHYSGGREWPYKDVKPRIIAEQYMDNGTAGGLIDYKFYCFGGKPKFLYISRGLEKHDTAAISFFDLNGNKMPFSRADYPDIRGDVSMPSRFKEMQEIAAVLAEKVNSPFLRVDLYQIKDEIYFSELTFSPCGGYMPFVPEEYDLKIGNLIDLGCFGNGGMRK